MLVNNPLRAHGFVVMRQDPAPLTDAVPWPSAARRVLLVLVLGLAGCRSTEKMSPWAARPLAPATLSPATAALTARWQGGESTELPADQVIEQASLSFTKHQHRARAFALAELHYAAGVRAAAAHSDTCVDLFYQAAGFAYFHLFGPGSLPADPKADERMRDVYNSSVARLIQDGQLFCRLDPKKHLLVRTPAGPQTVPVAHRLEPWCGDDIDQLVVVGDYEPADFRNRHGQAGLGVPLVAVRHRRGDGTKRDEFMFEKHPFAATVLLHPDLEVMSGKNAVVTAAHAQASGARLAFYDPGRVTSVNLSGQNVQLAGDLSAPLQYCVDASRQFHLDLLGFRHPGGRAAKMSGLFLLEPYQPGKIPVVLVHGLLSDVHTWDEMLNELRADPELCARFQFAVYMYPTGNPFLLSAGTLRKKLQELSKLDDPQHPDPALAAGVLIGHSMGGVLSRFQVTRSEDLVWQLVARRPLDQLVAPPATRALLQDSFYFDAQPFIKRVVFIATPHRGSTLARNIVGRIGASLVTPPAAIVQTRDMLLAENPGAFNPAFARYVPTSVEDLAAGSPILDVMQKLPFGPEVRLHSIIGRGHLFPLLQPGDGYVPIASAHLDGVESELFVNAEHTTVHREPESVREVKRILKKHAAEMVLVDQK